MAKPNLDELQSAYDAAMLGSDHPTLATYYCPECDRGFLLSAYGGGEDPCEHLLALLKEYS